MLRITILLGNISLLILLIYELTRFLVDNELTYDILSLFIPLLILSILNIYFVIGTYKGPVSLHLKRKRLEEENKFNDI